MVPAILPECFLFERPPDACQCPRSFVRPGHMVSLTGTRQARDLSETQRCRSRAIGSASRSAGLSAYLGGCSWTSKDASRQLDLPNKDGAVHNMVLSHWTNSKKLFLINGLGVVFCFHRPLQIWLAAD